MVKQAFLWVFTGLGFDNGVCSPSLAAYWQSLVKRVTSWRRPGPVSGANKGVRDTWPLLEDELN